MGSCQAVFPQSELLRVAFLGLPAECHLCAAHSTFCSVSLDFSLSRALESLILSIKFASLCIFIQDVRINVKKDFSLRQKQNNTIKLLPFAHIVPQPLVGLPRAGRCSL